MVPVKKMVVLTFMILLMVSPFARGAGIREVVLATGEWPPYTSEHMKGYGIFTEIVAAVFSEMGVKPVYHFNP